MHRRLIGWPATIACPTFSIAALSVALFATAVLTIASPAVAEENAAEKSAEIHQGHRLLQENATGATRVGKRIEDFRIHSVSGDVIELSELLESGPATFVYLSTKCPLAKRYTQRLIRLHEKFAADDVSLIAVFPNSDETDTGIRQYAEQCKFEFPVIRDVAGYLTDRMGATMTPQAFLIDQDATLRYRGAIDDNRYVNRVKTHYLDDAVRQLVGGETITTESSKALGCSIHLDEVTYSGSIAGILQNNCQSCHRDGQVAPFALTNYKEAATWATEIQKYTGQRLMPPWKASPGFGVFKNDISLSQEEIILIEQWVHRGAKLGNENEIPTAPEFNDGWAFGEPDMIVRMPESYTVGPEGEDDYRHFVIPHSSDEDIFVEAIDVRPGNRNVVHHVIVYTDTSKDHKARRLDEADPGPGYTRFGGTGFDPASTLGGWAPGNFPTRTPRGTGQLLPQKSDIVLQVHYYRTGIEERDQTEVGLYFSKSPKPVRAWTDLVINTKFKLAPGEVTTVKGSKSLKRPSTLFSVTPHMHLIGESMRVWAIFPEGESYPDGIELIDAPDSPSGKAIPLVKIDDWDFNWQTTYHLPQPIALPAGTVVKMEAVFDNTSDNPNNPNSPPAEIRWGERTTDEMCIAFFGMIPTLPELAELNRTDLTAVQSD